MANCIPHLVRKRVTCKVLKHLTTKQIGAPLNSNRKYGSSLLAKNNESKEVFTLLTPYLDIEQRLADIEKLQRDLTARGLNWNTEDIKSMWEFYKSMKADHSRLQLRSKEISEELAPLFKSKELTAEQEINFKKLKMQIKFVKEDLKLLNNSLQELNASIVEKMYQIPNEVDGRTPIQMPVILKRVNSLNERSDSEKMDHVEIGRRLGLLEYRNPMQYYLCNDAAVFELGVLNYAGKILSEDNMIRVAGADFSRSLLINGSGLNHGDPADAFIINNHNDVEKNSANRMHLVGGASLISFLAMHAKQLIEVNHFPVAYFSTGRQYTPFRPGSTPIGLFTVCQTSAVVAFMLVKDGKSQEYHTQFERLLNNVCKLYDNVCDHYQVVVRPAAELRPWEAMRVSFELWSSFSKQYIEVGHISICGEYFSKKLLILYQTPNGRAFPSVISGTLLSVPRLLGCLLEQNPDKFVIPPKILQYMLIDHAPL
ncbi:serine--tRNA synthetase-like protein Slimp [Xylocopa sonorina]|uniref:serine--tRNA synthetase-like protein Slimp n=1 Tax=Xylocopa sonorina TaxID=1818115 RepID=UPI00403AD59D